MKKMRLAIAVCGVLIGALLVGALLLFLDVRGNVGQPPVPPGPPPGPPPGIIWITPAEFVASDAADVKRVVSHLGWATGAVRVQYSGPKEYIQLIDEVWENGEKGVNTRSIGLTDLPVDGTVSISLERDLNAQGSSRFDRLAVVYPQGTSWRPVHRSDSGTEGTWRTAICRSFVEVTDADEPIVWVHVFIPSVDGMTVYSEPAGGYTPKSLEELVRTARWALVVRVSFTDLSHGRLHQGD